MHIFQMTSGFKIPNTSRNTRWNCNFSLPLKKFTSQASPDPNSTYQGKVAKNSGRQRVEFRMGHLFDLLSFITQEREAGF